MGSETRTHDNTQPNYRKPIRAAIMAVFTARPGQVVWLSEIQQATGETNPRRVQAAMAAMAAMVREADMGLAVHTRGQAWTYRPTPAAQTPTRRMFEEIGPTKDGAVVIQDDAGRLYRATEL